MKQKKFYMQKRIHLFIIRVVQHGKRLPRGVVESQNYSKPERTQTYET